MKKVLIVALTVLLVICNVYVCTGCDDSIPQEQLPVEYQDKTHDVQMLCAFSSAEMESHTETTSVTGYSYNIDGSFGIVSGSSSYTYKVPAAHYYIVGKINQQYFLISFGSDATTFMLAAGKENFQIDYHYGQLFGNAQYSYHRDINNNNHNDRVSLTELSEEEAYTYVKMVKNSVDAEVTAETTQI